MNLDKMLCSYDNNTVIPREEAVLSTIKTAKDAYWDEESSRCISWMEFMYQQLFYIRKTWWLIQFGVLFAIWILLKVSGSGPYSERCMGILAPIFIILVLPELWKNVSNRSIEIEGASYYSFQKIMAARMIVFGLVDLMMLTIFVIVSVSSTEVPMTDLIVQFLLPMLITSCICFRAFSGRLLRGIVPSITVSLLWMAIWLFIVLREDVFTRVSGFAWGLLLVISVSYLCYCIYRIMKDYGRILAYNFMGEM
ncbi:hypothetical protein NXH67_04110 [Butyrivibrio sp. DSM 10294]|uniref:hypothetical protein n=1 Tax=Butyrivibrio sp. DSM 10294 TaxID=2972457 RepID=UPI00234FB5C0|nr:hypothetical protein [Butyrivibrio sp. DSM 10294]MDC7292697.1 hypothetical protein [Butyrivibrio sp. DSM 10294]